MLASKHVFSLPSGSPLRESKIITSKPEGLGTRKRLEGTCSPHSGPVPLISAPSPQPGLLAFCFQLPSQPAKLENFVCRLDDTFCGMFRNPAQIS